MGIYIHSVKKASVSIRILLGGTSLSILPSKRKPRNQFTLLVQASTEQERMKLFVGNNLFAPLSMKAEGYPGDAQGITKFSITILYFSASLIKYRVLIMYFPYI